MKKISSKKNLILSDSTNNYRLLKKYMHHKDKYHLIVETQDEDVNNCIKAINIDNLTERNKFIYETICDVLDKKWNHNLPCEFCHNRCIASRNKYMDKEFDGCCYSFKRKRFGKVKKQKCIHLKDDKTCDTKNISCKLFTCNYLKKNHLFSTSYDNYLLLKLFFNKKEKLILKYNFFKTEEEVLAKLNKKSIKPYVLYLLCFDFLIEK